jgi:hypothetical protein
MYIAPARKGSQAPRGAAYERGYAAPPGLAHTIGAGRSSPTKIFPTEIFPTEVSIQVLAIRLTDGNKMINQTFRLNR